MGEIESDATSEVRWYHSSVDSWPNDHRVTCVRIKLAGAKGTNAIPEVGSKARVVF